MLKEQLKNEELLKVVKKILEKFHVDVIILFGSRARGDYKPWSDYDILIIANFKEKYLDRIAEILELLNEIKITIEPHPYTLKEAIEMLKKGNPIIVDAISEGLILYEGEGLKELLKVYEELLKKGLKKSEVSIILP
ncbi:MAG: nucleotidyltransferase domain-containing protein [Candidatus Methanomethylicaceae archaeon]|nr:nucleotidyltransferase domain-containing protein [Candidatus Verstraetearchaeota archaeon]